MCGLGRLDDILEAAMDEYVIVVVITNTFSHNFFFSINDTTLQKTAATSSLVILVHTGGLPYVTYSHNKMQQRNK